MHRVIATVLIVLTTASSTAFADDSINLSHAKVSASPIADSVARITFDRGGRYPLSATHQSRKKNSTATKITAGGAMRVLGMLGGAYVGAALQPDCHCDDPGLTGAFIGMPIGAMAGAIAGVLLASR